MVETLKERDSERWTLRSNRTSDDKREATIVLLLDVKISFAPPVFSFTAYNVCSNDRPTYSDKSGPPQGKGTETHQSGKEETGKASSNLQRSAGTKTANMPIPKNQYSSTSVTEM